MITANKISVVTVVYNAVAVLEDTILSILGQTYTELQFIVIDGGSIDGTLDVLKRYHSRIDVLISEPDNGIYDAMNKAIPLCNGDWTIFMNVGDIFYSPDTLDHLFSCINHKGVSIIYGNHIAAYGSLQVFKYPRPLKDLWKGMTIQHQSIFVRTEILRNRSFNLTYKFAADYDLFYECYKNGYKIEHIDTFISIVEAKGFSESNSLKTYNEFKTIASKFENNAPYINAYYKRILLKRKLIGIIRFAFPFIDNLRLLFKRISSRNLIII